MRIKAMITANESKCKVPVSYRQNIASLIKDSIKKTDPLLKERYWGDENNKNNVEKPFTFALAIFDSVPVKENGVSFLESKSGRMELFLSSNNPDFIITCYNGLCKSNYQPFTFKTTFSNFNLCKEREFNKDECIFKTMSPLVVRNMNVRDNKHKKGAEYLTMGDESFTENLFASVKNLCSEFLPRRAYLAKDDFVFTPLDYATVKVYHYNHVIAATTGTFKIQANSEILKLIYDVGLGARRSQGFGMLEVVG
ncbi:MAG TPA: CRISPR-associated endoribonuclease Cas6 [Spirochaetota bacterium]|nr:CRISPR-associated endoribonuclease Cas6 [Spirochaetota bacterium]HRS63057.1 CRISPR-associated endoribonuclease Cas6 [Spirochaetota bacterium]HRU66613.1 CRISPR-associated endoribonuclease Cas6 [Spirochaetota bacterium]